MVLCVIATFLTLVGAHRRKALLGEGRGSHNRRLYLTDSIANKPKLTSLVLLLALFLKMLHFKCKSLIAINELL